MNRILPFSFWFCLSFLMGLGLSSPVVAQEKPGERMMTIRGQQVPARQIIQAYEKMKGSYVYDRNILRKPISVSELMKRWEAANKSYLAGQKKKNQSNHRKPNRKGGNNKSNPLTVEEDAQIGRLPEPKIESIQGTVYRRSGISELVVQTGPDSWVQVVSDHAVQPGRDGNVSITGWKIETYVDPLHKDPAKRSKPQQLRLLTAKGEKYIDCYRNVTFTPKLLMGALQKGMQFPELANVIKTPERREISVPGLANQRNTGLKKEEKPSISKPGRATPNTPSLGSRPPK